MGGGGGGGAYPEHVHTTCIVSLINVVFSTVSAFGSQFQHLTDGGLRCEKGICKNRRQDCEKWAKVVGSNQ